MCKETPPPSGVARAAELGRGQGSPSGVQEFMRGRESGGHKRPPETYTFQMALGVF